MPAATTTTTTTAAAEAVRPDDRYRLGVDVGGTFTDLLLINARTSAIAAKAKVPSTPQDPSQGVQVRYSWGRGAWALSR
jgi:activator of 2-hydroxyglutaryl-CoA dehydratase